MEGHATPLSSLSSLRLPVVPRGIGHPLGPSMAALASFPIGPYGLLDGPSVSFLPMRLNGRSFLL